MHTRKNICVHNLHTKNVPLHALDIHWCAIITRTHTYIHIYYTDIRYIHRTHIRTVIQHRRIRRNKRTHVSEPSAQSSFVSELWASTDVKSIYLLDSLAYIYIYWRVNKANKEVKKKENFQRHIRRAKLKKIRLIYWFCWRNRSGKC